jgi:hypothetical protein
MARVTVVLFCKGRGGDPASYQPLRDESQWWNRRDALVRCVISFLYGPQNRLKHEARQLILRHDDDEAVTTMLPSDSVLYTDINEDWCPREENIVSLWKAAAKDSPNSIDMHGLTCSIVKPASKSQSLTVAEVSQLENKRLILEHLQQNCSIDFLRTHRLNSSIEVVLRKTNKKALVQLWHEWLSGRGESFPSLDHLSLSTFFTNVLQSTDHTASNTIAVTLHESAESELPVFTVIPDKILNDTQAHVVVFLGAVRDMSIMENEILREVCERVQVRLTHVRLGPVPEFTSKILSILAFHQSQYRLYPAIVHRLQTKGEDVEPPGQTKLSKRRRLSTVRHEMHVVTGVPFTRAQVSVALHDRKRPLWELIRLIVCTLWRSKVASVGAFSETGLTVMYMHILLSDGATVSLTQEKFINEMAEQHQAAPSEYQVLMALCRILMKSNQQELSEAATALFSTFAEQKMYVIQCAAHSRYTKLWRQMLKKELDAASMTTRTPHSLVVLLRSTNTNNAINVSHNALISAVPPSWTILSKEISFCGVGIDAAAATIVMLQHFLYQNRLWISLDALVQRERKSRCRE